jgi:hypothetical protein
MLPFACGSFGSFTTVDGLTDVERLLVRGEADAVGVVEVVGNLDPRLTAGCSVEGLPATAVGTSL